MSFCKRDSFTLGKKDINYNFNLDPNPQRMKFKIRSVNDLKDLKIENHQNLVDEFFLKPKQKSYNRS